MANRPSTVVTIPKNTLSLVNQTAAGSATAVSAGKPGQKPTADTTQATTRDTGKTSSNDNSALAQLLVAPNAPQPAANPTPAAETPAPQPAADATTAPSDALTQFTDAVASSMVGNGANVKTPRSAKTESGTTSADNQKTEARASTATTLGTLSTAATRNFAAPSGTATNNLPFHAPAGQKPGVAASTTVSAGDTSTSQPQTGTAPQANDVRPAAQAAVQPATPATQPAQVSVPPAAAATVAAAGSVAATAPTTTPQTPVTLQVTTANAPAVLDANTLAVSIAAKSQGGAKHFDIRLSPAELGRVDVRLTVDDSGKAQASLTVEKPQTLALLQKDSTQLERAIKDAGLDLSQNGLNFSLKGQQQQNGNGNAPTSRGRVLNVRAIAAVETAPSSSSPSGVGASDARLDIRV